MSAKGLVTIKRNAGTSVTEEITAIDKTHPDVREFIMTELPLPDNSSATPIAVYQSPDIKEMLLASGKVLAFLKPFGYQKGSALTSVDLRKCLNDYVKNNNLQNETDRGNVTLDPILADIVLGRGENNVFKLPWPDLISRIQGKMQPAYQLTFPGMHPTVHKGKIEAIKLSVVQRASNKKATCIENLEVYGISAEEFAHHVQIGVSCSTSVSPMAQKNKGLQVMVQGNQVRFISDLLMNKYQISRRNIEGLEKASKKR